MNSIISHSTSGRIDNKITLQEVVCKYAIKWIFIGSGAFMGHAPPQGVSRGNKTSEFKIYPSSGSLGRGIANQCLIKMYSGVQSRALCPLTGAGKFGLGATAVRG